MNKRKVKNQKDLTVQTEDIGPPPLLTLKSSVSSPVSTFHNLFHRTGTLPSAGIESIDEQIPRSIVNLSSNNSNSTVADVSFAQVYKFTDSSYAIEEDNEDNEAFKKLFMPADHFIKSKLPASPMVEEENEEAHFWSTMMTLIKPVALQSQQRKLSNGLKGPPLIMTEDDIANFVRENYTTNLSSKGSERDDIKAREIIQDLRTFFTRILITFDKDFRENWIISKFQINVEQLLLNVFKEVLVIPLIQFRKKQDAKDNNFLVNYMDGALLYEIVQCFGMINSVQVYEQNDETGFLDLFVWLTQL
ncbi:hypothetical protein PSN45_004473 [Yamadazyma tenuis]|uniref:uncharacterized protein n=1 Tax=Candida tenuis TaxID=2315449 RepID=UPI00279E1F9A|nr:hypothetical protein PSN45_004473 [Yamadazyma tenuis]